MEKRRSLQRPSLGEGQNKSEDSPMKVGGEGLEEISLN